MISTSLEEEEEESSRDSLPFPKQEQRKGKIRRQVLIKRFFEYIKRVPKNPLMIPNKKG